MSRKRLAETCSNGALGTERRGRATASSGESAVAGATMSPLPRARVGKGPLSLALTLLAGVLVAGLVARAGVGMARGR